ncbi:hypothetical protein EYV94_25495 [Puteibacter caeruleilacunae]|nr:hypothetical protein EYV94_25495 [Puteibacter caeruleilacunae]
MKILSFCSLIVWLLFAGGASAIEKTEGKKLSLEKLTVMDDGFYRLPKAKGSKVMKEVLDVTCGDGDVLSLDFKVDKASKDDFENRGCVAAAGYRIDGCNFIVDNNKKDLRIYVGYGDHTKSPYYIINRHTERNKVTLHVKKISNGFEWMVEGVHKNIGNTIEKESKSKKGVDFVYVPVNSGELNYSVGNLTIGAFDRWTYEEGELHPLFKYEATAVNKYDWEEPAAKHLVLEDAKGKLTEKELNGLEKYLLGYELPRHNHMNYYFRKRMNSYMMEWVYEQTNNIKLVDRAIEVARRAIHYRNDNFGKYKISYDRSVAPLWPNFKEVEVYEDGTTGLVPGAATFAGLPTISVAVRMIASHQDLWNKSYQGVSYKEIAMGLIDEALKTIDYTYDVFVGEDNLIRYPNTLLRKEWHGRVYIFNRVFPVISGSIPLVEAMEKFGIREDKVKEIDAVNQAMIDYLKSEMVFYGNERKQCLRYPYSQALKEKAALKGAVQVEDFTHGSFDSRDFQLFYKSGRYNFGENIIKAMANTLADLVVKGDGKFAGTMSGKGKAKSFGTPISFDGFIWYAQYRPELYDSLINHILDNGVAKKNGVYDVYCLYEILKMKER